MTTPYRPSNGTEGEIFMAQWCDRCTINLNYRGDPDNEEPCQIMGDTMIYNVDDPQYPKEWILSPDSGQPRCTAYRDVWEKGEPVEPLDPNAVIRPLL